MQNTGYFVVLWVGILVELLSCHWLNCYDSYYLFSLCGTAILFIQKSLENSIQNLLFYMISVTNWDYFAFFIFKVKNNKDMIFQYREA